MISKKDLINYFFEGIKPAHQMKIGVEHEKFILNKKSLKPLSYEQKGGIKDIFGKLIELGWAPITEGKQETIIALKRKSEYITLEPGGQIELSGEQLKTIHQTCLETSNHLNELKNLSQEYNFILLGMGVEPNLSLSDFPWMPKQRYTIMKQYMEKIDTLGHHMMQRSCTSQVNFDYNSEIDMIRKFRVLLNFESVGTAIFANSPFDKGKPSKYKSLRSHFWHHTDKDRTGLTPFVFNRDFSFESYANYALSVPMYFIKRDEKYIDMTGTTFKNFLEKNIDKNGKKYDPTIADWADHLSTLFPQVRLKQYLEVRSMDACSWKEICSPAAFWTGILYDEQSLSESYDLTQDWTQEDRFLVNENVPEHGLKTKIQNKTLLEFSKILIKISEEGLKRRNNLSSNGEYDETYYLKNIKENINNNMSPADFLLQKYNGIWNKSVDSIYKELIF
jgi:glutamate--cysteine ligase